MSNLRKENGSENQMFKWGNEMGVGRRNKDVHFYESFTYDGVEYCLNDCAYFYREGGIETDIGKLVKIYETETHEKKVKVVWFFRPMDIRNFLGDYEPKWNELFLASGKGKGLFNFNHVESIIGKCNVLCMSNDKRNPPADEQQLKMADYIFCRCFDVGKCQILDSFADHICGITVELFFNKRRNQKLSDPRILKTNVKELTGKSVVLEKNEGYAVKDGRCPVVKEPKKPAENVGEHTFPNKRTASSMSEELYPPNVSCPQPFKKRKLLDVKEDEISDEAGAGVGQVRGVESVNQPMETTGNVQVDKKKWFKELPWEDRVRSAYQRGTLVSLENLDPSFTSSEVKDLVWGALGQKVEARMIQRATFSSPHYGKALVIFPSADAAKFAILKLRKKCLMLSDGRLIVGREGKLGDLSKPSRFIGHLVIDELKHRKPSEMRKAVFNSHCAQPNTIEYGLAMNWRMLQEKADKWWEALHKQQGEELELIRSQLKYYLKK